LAIWGNGIRWNETKHVELEQFWHAFTSRGFDSVSCAFLFYQPNSSRICIRGH